MAERIRILCCTGSLDGGGSERQLAQLASGLNSELFDTSIYLQYRRGIHLDSVPKSIPIFAFSDHHKAPLLNWPGRIRNQQIRHLRSIIRNHKIDIVYDRTYHATLLTGAACKGLSVKRVSTIVSPPEHDFAQRELRHTERKRRLLAEYYQSADRVITVSHGTADSAQSYYNIDDSNFEIIPSPIDRQRILDLAAGYLPAELASEFDPSKCNIIMVARMTPEKGHADLLDAIAELPDSAKSKIVVYMVGDGPLREKLIQRTAELHITESVRFQGYQQNPYRLMARCDLLCLPSHYEGLPNVLLEAATLGVPTLAYDCPTGPREILGENGERGELVPVRDFRKLALAIAGFIQNSTRWRERAATSVQYVADRHSLPAWLQQMEDLFESLLSKSRMGSSARSRLK